MDVPVGVFGGELPVFPPIWAATGTSIYASCGQPAGITGRGGRRFARSPGSTRCLGSVSRDHKARAVELVETASGLENLDQHSWSVGQPSPRWPAHIRLAQPAASLTRDASSGSVGHRKGDVGATAA